MILVITETEKNDWGNYSTFASHGIDLSTGQVIILPQISPEALGAEYDYNVGEYVIREEEDQFND